MSEDELPWSFDERAHVGPEHLDPEFVAAYDQKQGVDDVDDLTPFSIRGVGADATVVDFGAGTGRFTIAAAATFRRVIAVEPSPAMLVVLRDRVAWAGLDNVACVPEGFLSYLHDGPPVDGVYTRNALHHLPDFWKTIALHRIAEIMRTGGVLRLRDLIYDFEPASANRVIFDWLRRAPRDPARGYTPTDLAEHVRTEHSTMRWLLEPMLDHAGFDIVEVGFRGPTYGTYTCVRR